MKNENLINRWRIAFLVICTIGCCLSADLQRLHVKVHTDPEYHSYCAISERVNCETVAASDYAVLFTLPLALWGIIAYLVLGALSVWSLRRPLTPASWPFGFLFWFTLFSSIFSIYLFMISHFIIKSVCVVCTGTYLVNFSLLGITLAELRQLKTRPVKALKADIQFIKIRKFSFMLLVLAPVVALIILWFTVPPYWRLKESIGPGGFPIGTTIEGYPWIGANKPKLVIAEFSDYQCPYCRRGHDEMRKLIETYPDRVRVVHRHYPLDNECNADITRPFHPSSCAYARMAFCAQQQGRFWEANDYLFKNGRRPEPVTPDELAASIKIDAGLLKSCAGSSTADSALQNDLSEGRFLNIRGTPTYVIGDKTFPGRIPPEVLSSSLQ